MRSVFLWQENASRSSLAVVANRLSNNPDAHPACQRVGGQKTRIVLQRLVIELLVFVVEVPPVACDVAAEELLDALSRRFESFQRTGSGDDLSNANLGLSVFVELFCMFHLSS